LTGLTNSRKTESTTNELLTFRNTLAFKIALLVNATVIVVLVASESTEFLSEQDALKSQESAKLCEEAKVLAVAQRRLTDPDEYQAFIDDYCQQMSALASPGHHILILNDQSSVALRAHARATPELESRMISVIETKNEIAEFEYKGQRYLLAADHADSGRAVLVAQSLEPMLQKIWRRAISHLVGVGILTLLIFVVTGGGLWLWVRRPLRQLVGVVHQVGQGIFDARANGTGSAGITFLADGVNAMSESLGRMDDARRVEMDRARRIQQRLLPPHSAQFDGLELASAFEPATSVAGDIFDCMELADGSVVLTVIDVAGHGVPAALYTALLRTVLRYELRDRHLLSEVLAAANKRLHEVSSAGDFATCFIARILPDKSRIEYAKAGHDAGVLLHPDGRLELLDCDGLPLGVLRDGKFEDASVPFGSGDRLLLYTDGLHELFDSTGAQFGYHRLHRLFRDTRKLPVAEQVSQVIATAHAFHGSGAFADDVTLVNLALA